VEDVKNRMVSVDLGFGWTKGKRLDKIFRQPSVLGEPRYVHDDTIRDDDIMYGNSKYFVGNLAVRQSNIRYYTISNNKAQSWTTKILLQCALAHLIPDQSSFVITGLPLDFFFKQKRDMEKLLDEFKHPQDFQVSFGRNNHARVRNIISQHNIVPQPLGAGMNYLLDDNGKIKDELESKQIIVVGDLGFHTFDLLVLDGMEIHRYSHSDTEISIANTYKQIQEYLRDKSGKAPDIYQLDMHILRGEYEGLDLSPLISRAFQSLANQIDFAVQSLNLNYHKLILTGGWASIIADYISNLDSKKTVVYNQDGNIDGYLKIGRRIWESQSNVDLEMEETTT
jgi:hypothetical protein